VGVSTTKKRYMPTCPRKLIRSESPAHLRAAWNDMPRRSFDAQARNRTTQRRDERVQVEKRVKRSSSGIPRSGTFLDASGRCARRFAPLSVFTCRSTRHAVRRHSILRAENYRTRVQSLTRQPSLPSRLDLHVRRPLLSSSPNLPYKTQAGHLMVCAPSPTSLFSAHLCLLRIPYPCFLFLIAS
jgi:hypothetical protein